MPRSDCLWISVAELDCMQDCKDYIMGGELQDDQGKSLKFRWHPTVPGNGKRTCQFQCISHVNCGFMAKGVLSAGSYWVQVVADVEHSREPMLKQRTNAILSDAQLEEMRLLVNAGAKPSAIQSSFTVKELEKCKKKKVEAPKRPNGGLAGERG